jgi:hypothetical protein
MAAASASCSWAHLAMRRRGDAARTSQGQGCSWVPQVRGRREVTQSQARARVDVRAEGGRGGSWGLLSLCSVFTNEVNRCAEWGVV